MSYVHKKKVVNQDGSSLILTFTLGLLLLSLFIALSANRVPNRIRKNEALRSIATNFRKSSSTRLEIPKLKNTLTADLSNPGIVKLTALIDKFFGSDTVLSPDIKEEISQLANQVKLTNASLELYCQSPTSGVSIDTAYQRLTVAESRCERIAEIFRQEGVPSFNVLTRAGFAVNSNSNIQFVIRGESFRSSWE